MNPDLFPLLNASAPVKLLMGANPLRVWPWGQAPDNPKKPYAVYEVYNANPENYLDQVPDIDNKGTQINIYADSAASLEACYLAIRNTLEPHAHMTSFATPALDEETELFSCRMEFDFWDAR